jgi:hypothetical protein
LFFSCDPDDRFDWLKRSLQNDCIVFDTEHPPKHELPQYWDQNGSFPKSLVGSFF